MLNYIAIMVTLHVCGGLSDWLCLSVCLSGICLSTQKSCYLVIYRVKDAIAKHGSNIEIKKKKMTGCVPDSYQSSSIHCISSSFLFKKCYIPPFFYTVTTRIRRGVGIYGLWTCVHIGCTLWVWIHTNSSINQVCSPARSQL